MCGFDKPHPYPVSFTYRTKQATADEIQEGDRVHLVSWHLEPDIYYPSELHYL